VARPSVDGLERDTQGRLNVVRVDIQSPAAELVIARYGVRGTPTYILVDGDGREVWRQVGGSPDRPIIEHRLTQLVRR